jgi:hypothetical protein
MVPATSPAEWFVPVDEALKFCAMMIVSPLA